MDAKRSIDDPKPEVTVDPHVRIPRSVRKRANEVATWAYPSLYVAFATVSEIKRRRADIREAYLVGWAEGQEAK